MVFPQENQKGATSQLKTTQATGVSLEVFSPPWPLKSQKGRPSGPKLRRRQRTQKSPTPCHPFHTEPCELVGGASKCAYLFNSDLLYPVILTLVRQINRQMVLHSAFISNYLFTFHLHQIGARREPPLFNGNEPTPFWVLFESQKSSPILWVAA